jgi:CHASE3 domain sensor protein
MTAGVTVNTGALIVFNKMSIGLRITVGFLSIVVLMAALGIFAVLQLKNVQSRFEEIGLEGTRAIRAFLA